MDETPSSSIGRAGGLAALAAAAILLFAAAPARAQNVRAAGVDSVRIRMNLQPQFDTSTVDDVPSSEWFLRRARIMARAYAAGWIRGEVEADFAKGGAKLTDGFVRMDFPRLSVQAGQFKRPFDALELTSSRELPVIERGGAPRGTSGLSPHDFLEELGHNARDIGAMATVHGARARASLAAFNGSGANAAENTDGKQVVARVGVDVAPGWTAWGAWSGRRDEAPIAGTDATEGVWHDAFEVAVTGGEYLEPGLRVLGQAFFGDNPDVDLGGGPDAGFRAFQAVASWDWPVYRVPYLIAVEPAVRVGWTDPNTDVDSDEATLWTVGLNLYHQEHVKTQIGIDALSPAGGDTQTALRVQATLGF